jgi:acyl-ACP thioesterase
VSVGSYGEWFTVRGYEVDENNLLKIQCLSDYLQEAAGIHAAMLGLSIERLQAANLTWVLSRLQFAPETMPAAASRVRVETWPVGVEGVQFRRDFRVTSERGERVARAVSHWVAVNLTTRRVGRVPGFIAAVALGTAETVMDEVRGKPPAPDRGDERCRFTARLADMDRNRHVNNVRYMDWMLESLPDATRAAAPPVFLDMLFKAEAVRGDIVSARVREEEAADAFPGAAVYGHTLVREAGDRELVRGRSVWKKMG